jgi:hypothetical protein
MKLGRVLTALSVSAACAAFGIAPASAAGGTTVISWDMNEPAGASVMHDSGPLGIDGQIGSEVITGVAVGGAVGYQFPRLKPNTPPTHPEHLVVIPDQTALDPETGNYTVEIRYRTTNGFGNLIQKGQSHSAGGQWKIQLPGGRPQCYFKGSGGKAGAGWKTPIDDGQWHTLRCVRTPDSVTLYVDGVRRGRKVGPTGNMNNKFPVTIGGKQKCDQITVTCDYFGGTVDYVRIEKG